MYSETLACCNKAKNIITRNGFTTVCQVINNAVAAFSKDDQFGILFCHGRLCSTFRSRLRDYPDRFWRFKFVTKKLELMQLLQIDSLYRDLVIKVEWRRQLIIGGQDIYIVLVV